MIRELSFNFQKQLETLFVQLTTLSVQLRLELENWGMAGVGRTSGDHLVQLPAKAGSPEQVMQEQSRWVWIISTGDSTTSLGSFLQCSITLKVEKFFSSSEIKHSIFTLCCITGFDFLKNTSSRVSTPFIKTAISRKNIIPIIREIQILHTLKKSKDVT